MKDQVSASREVTWQVLFAVLEKGEKSHICLELALAKYGYLKKEDRAFITRTTEGTIANMLFIDSVTDSFASVKTKKQKPAVRTILRMSVYQLLFMDRVPDRAVTDEAVRLAKAHHLEGLSGFINAVLRKISREKDSISACSAGKRYSMPDWLTELFAAQMDAATMEAMLRTFLRPPELCINAGADETARKETIDMLNAAGIAVRPHSLVPWSLYLEGENAADGLAFLKSGRIFIQDVSSSLVGAIAARKKDALVLDLCAAPGGKTMDTAARLCGGRVIASDISEKKTELIAFNVRQRGLDNVDVAVRDAAVFHREFEDCADVVLADLPCSGLGILAKKPEIKYRLTKESIKELVLLQRQILENAVRYVRPGGCLIYSTCTIDKKENEDQREWLLENFALEADCLDRVPGTEMTSETLRNGGYMQLIPGRDESDGFFFAVFKKK